MTRYYTRVCNFYYGAKSKILVEKNKSLPLHGIKEISFDQIEIITRKSKKKIFINQINKLPHLLRKKINSDLRKITPKKKGFCKYFLHLIKVNPNPDPFPLNGLIFTKKNFLLG